MTTPVIIEDYDPSWPECFEVLRSRIHAALDPLVSAIEHVGSTAVPGLAAKPIIDLDVLLRSDGDLPRAIECLTAIGYAHRGDLGIPGREAFRAPASEFRHHLYLCPPHSRAYLQHLAFRDYLRTHPEDARAYELLKRSLASRYGNDRDDYTQAKTEFIEGILRQAAVISHTEPESLVTDSHDSPASGSNLMTTAGLVETDSNLSTAPDLAKQIKFTPPRQR